MPRDTDPDAVPLPDSWTEDARDVVTEVLAETPDLHGSALASLFQVGAMLTAADRLDAVAADAGMVALGSTGQTVIHPAVTEARLARTAAAAVLHRLRPDGAARRTRQARNAARVRHAPRRRHDV